VPRSLERHDTGKASVRLAAIALAASWSYWYGLAPVVLAEPPLSLSLEKPSAPLLTGAHFRTQLDQPLSADWSNVPLRDVLARLSQDRQIALLRDRRIDPDRPLTLQIRQARLREGLEQLARRCGAAVSVVGNTVYLGPPRAASDLRTLVRLRTDELLGRRGEIPERRTFDLSRRQTIAWSDLAEPRQILTDIAQRYDLRIEGLERIPHDLWPRAALPEADAIEALSLVLVQFDRTFRWGPQARRIELVSLPDVVAIEKRYTVPAPRAQSLMNELKQRWPNVEFRQSGRQVVVLAKIEAHEWLDQRLRPRAARSKPTSSSGPSDRPPPLRRRLFTLRVQNVPVIAIMKKLEATGAVFRYDPKAFAAAGIDLNQRVDIDVHQATADEFFRAIFEPLKVRAEIDDLTVTLRPR